jgi:hypothetical protein
MCCAMIHTPKLVGVLTFGGQRWNLVYSTAERVFAYNGSLSLYAWQRVGIDRYEWVGVTYVRADGRDLYHEAVLAAKRWEDRRVENTVRVAHVISGILEHTDVRAYEALDYCKELVAAHGEHVKHIGVYVGEERLWTYNHRTRKGLAKAV